ncbi:lysophospholipase L1-like esterase [Pontibacter ummariensis]|uniref:Lysophospholipase L1 n=1 Tax=Pontibacter ummariensis TaxID=1610492 RepID=A0A239H3A8_9BACT|nr:rhamnogalacturonan acetylesterase [Pontibacter ummariensis]PRY10909.1 lysophospholipase L1-like esterase [Pontibacter ummariensis]SNS75672.1 Lysophospholipase L1 [Pontibacter ummariensis]
MNKKITYLIKAVQWALLAVLVLPLMSYVQKKESTIFLVGDSTVADKPYAKGNPEKGWGQVFPLYLQEGVRVENHAVNGRSTKSFRDEGRWDKVLQKLRKGDYVIIEFGHNDQKSEDPKRYAAPETDYRQNLERYIAETRAKGAIPVLATPIVRRKFENDQLVDTHGKYPEVVRAVAAAQQVPLLDLEKRTRELVSRYGAEKSKALYLHLEPNEYESLPQGRTDDTHLSAYGAFRVSDLVAEELQQNLPEVAKYLKK